MHGFRASFPASVFWRLGAALRRQRGRDDRLVRVHANYAAFVLSVQASAMTGAITTLTSGSLVDLLYDRHAKLSRMR